MICTVCGEKFGGLTAFDMHRAGKYPIANEKHPVPVGETARKWRRCLSVHEMMAKGLHRDGKGKWCRAFGHPRFSRTPSAKKGIAA